MIKLKTKLALFNLLSKLALVALFLLLLPIIIERINILQTDNELIHKREDVLQLISDIGIEPFISNDTDESFGSYNILKEEFISLETISPDEEWNFIEVSPRLIDDEIINYRVLNYSFKVNDETYLLEIGKSLKSIYLAQRNIRIVIIIFLIFFVFITLFSDLFYTSRILVPLKIITRKLKATSTPDLFDKNPVKTSTADFHQLDMTIRELMKQIDLLFQKEKEITVNISHELMTPVSVLRSKLENLLLQKNLDEDTSAKLEESLRTLHRLKTLINSLLLIARIESQQYLKEESFHIKDILKEVMEELIPIAEDAGITIHEGVREDLLFKEANRSLVFSMIFNIVNNAIKFTPANGLIDISSYRHDGRFLVTISDNGRGMTREQMDTLFSRFKRKSVKDQESTGIGLAITKSIADFHNIHISVTSNPGEGTKFTFTFP